MGTECARYSPRCVQVPLLPQWPVRPCGSHRDRHIAVLGRKYEVCPWSPPEKGMAGPSKGAPRALTRRLALGTPTPVPLGRWVLKPRPRAGTFSVLGAFGSACVRFEFWGVRLEFLGASVTVRRTLASGVGLSGPVTALRCDALVQSTPKRKALCTDRCCVCTNRVTKRCPVSTAFLCAQRFGPHRPLKSPIPCLELLVASAGPAPD